MNETLLRPTVAEIRDIVFVDPSRVTAPQLVALLLGRGTRSKKGDGSAKSWTAVELGEELYGQAGGRLSDFVAAIREGGIDLRDYGIGEKLGGRLITTMELAYRWRRGFRKGGNAEIRSEIDTDLPKLIFERREELSEGELLVPLLMRFGGGEEMKRLLEYCGSPRALVESLEYDSFTAIRKKGRVRMTIPEAGLELRLSQVGWLFAGLELVRRYRLQAKVEGRKLSKSASGLSMGDLVKLLDAERHLDRPLRESLIELLRSHPDLERDFGTLENLAGEAGVDSYEEAVEVHQMFEELRRHKKWSDPAEVVGPQVPFRNLLSVAEAKIAAASRPPKRVIEVREILLAAQRAAFEAPVGAFVDALLELGITDEGAREAIDEAKRRYFNQDAGAS